MKRKKDEKYSRVVGTVDEGSEDNQPLNLQQRWTSAMEKLGQELENCKKSLSEFPTDIYYVFSLKFLESYSYFALSQILVIYLHNEFGVSDIEAGMVYGMWGAAITLWGLMVSWVNDNLGVKYSLMLGFTISAISSTIVATTTSKIFVYVTLFAIYPFGTSMGIPMLTVAIKRYTKAKNRGFAFGLYYSVMNVAALVSGPVVDGFNIGLRNGVHVGKENWSGNRLVIFTCTLSNLMSLFVAWRYLREIKVTDNDSENSDVGDMDAVQCARNGSFSDWSTSDSEEDRGIDEGKVDKHWYNGSGGDDIRSGRVGGTESPVHGIGVADYVEHDDENSNDDVGHSAGVKQINQRRLVSCKGDKKRPNFVQESSTTPAIAPSKGSIWPPFVVSSTSPSPAVVLAVPSPLHTEERTGPELPVDDTSTGDGIELYVPKPQDPWTTVKELTRSATLWRFAALTLLLVNLHAIFRHLDATLPTYLVRCFGPGVPKGTLYSINPFMIIFLTPTVAALTNTYNHFNMIKWGGYLTAVSPFFPAMSTSIWAVVCMNIVLSLGEAVWSPRLYDYVMTIAPEGRESSFSALASAPLFAAKIPVGLMSGYLLATYLPEEGHQRPKILWLIIGIMTMTSPILITLFDPCIREPTGIKEDSRSRNSVRWLPSSYSTSSSDSQEDGRHPMHNSSGSDGIAMLDVELERSLSNVDVTISLDSEHWKGIPSHETDAHLTLQGRGGASGAPQRQHSTAVHVSLDPRAESLYETF